MSYPFALTLLSSPLVEMPLLHLIGTEGMLLSEDTTDLGRACNALWA